MSKVSLRVRALYAVFATGLCAVLVSCLGGGTAAYQELVSSTPDASGSSDAGGGPDGGATDGGSLARPDSGHTSDAGSRGEAWVWLFTNFSSALSDIAANPGSFTHVSPTLYDVNYSYASGVPEFWQGADSFDGLSSQQICQRVHQMGMRCIPAIFGGAGNTGTDQGIENILNNTSGAQTNFITSIVNEAVSKGYDGWNLDWEMGAALGQDRSTWGNKWDSFLSALYAAMHARGLLLSVDVL